MDDDISEGAWWPEGGPTDAPSEPRSRDEIAEPAGEAEAIPNSSPAEPPIPGRAKSVWVAAVAALAAVGLGVALVVALVRAGGAEEQLQATKAGVAELTTEREGLADQLERLESENAVLAQSFVIDRRFVPRTRPEGTFTVTSEITRCDGIDGCAEDSAWSWLDQVIVECDDACQVSSRPNSVLGSSRESLTFRADGQAWVAQGPWAQLTCNGEASSGSWELELRPTAVRMTPGSGGPSGRVDALTGTMRAEIPAGNCTAALLELSFDWESSES